MIGDSINQKESGERNKQVWILKTKEGKVLERFRQKKLVKDKKKYYLDHLFMETEIERDESYKERLKENLRRK